MLLHKNPPEGFSPKFEVASCYVEHDGNILFLNRPQHKPEGGTWGVPAGKVDSGETALQAMIRELWEETGLHVEPEKFEYLTKVYVTYPEYHFVYHMFRLRLNEKPDIVLREEEHEGFQWIAPQHAVNLPLVRGMAECLEISYGVRGE